jgi:diguanylate cyclase (GGDEF)-like protein
MIDLDNFKGVNDTYGHQAGDFILEQVANFLKRNLRISDFLARYGGEEFVVLLENTDIQQAQENLNALLLALRSQEFEYKANQLSVTFSCGLAECTSEDNSESLIGRADSNLYEAKRNGRNRIHSGPAALSATSATGN